jgi:hypothetical protein
LSATYQDNNIIYLAHVKKGTYLAIGYGTSMTNTDEVFWAAGTSVATSAVYDVYSTSDSFPAQDANNIYTSTLVVNGDFIDFTSQRILSPSETNSFTITLDTPIDMIWAYSAYNSAEGYSGCTYHNNNKSYPEGW